MLQNDYGWNIASHTNLHKNAVSEYAYTNNLKGYEDDVVDALQYLIKNDINSAPNWFIYPMGKTNWATKNVVGKYYKFARSTIDAPEIFPFTEPLEVKMLSVYSDTTGLIDVNNAIRDAVKYNQTIILMFHKFTEGAPSVNTEWQLQEFDSILSYIKKQGIKVITLSEFDEEHGIPQTQFVVHDFIPQQFDLDVSVTQNEN